MSLFGNAESPYPKLWWYFYILLDTIDKKKIYHVVNYLHKKNDFNSFSPGGCDFHFKYGIFKYIVVISVTGVSSVIAFQWMMTN